MQIYGVIFCSLLRTVWRKVDSMYRWATVAMVLFEKTWHVRVSWDGKRLMQKAVRSMNYYFNNRQDMRTKQVTRPTQTIGTATLGLTSIKTQKGVQRRKKGRCRVVLVSRERAVIRWHLHKLHECVFTCVVFTVRRRALDKNETTGNAMLSIMRRSDRRQGSRKIK